MPNRLARETSPYLLQHAENPVDWYPWGPEALERARREDRPILLSIGYAACHWCHVMEHESFENEATAALMNERFINIKVDREERPDLDAIYMQAVQSMTGHGGWPMTMILTPDAVPFFGGTYFPPRDRQGMPSFTRVLLAVSDAYVNRRTEVERTAASVQSLYGASNAHVRGSGAVDARLLERAYRVLEQRYDPAHGGFEGAPKFPHAMSLDFVLRSWGRTRSAAALEIVVNSFRNMARGGIYDQVGGGFSRYAVDAIWLVPHFEKMLYDNALLIRLGTNLWQATQDDEIRRATEKSIRWVAREMTSPEGGFFSSFDADSEGHEGKFYVWDLREAREVLGERADAMIDYWGMTAEGNFEGANILHVRNDPAAFAARHRLPLPALTDMLDSAERAMYERRAGRVWPGRDEKILASWNGLMLRAVAEAARVFGNEAYGTMARRNADFLWKTLVRDGRVMRVHKGGVTKVAGFLEDHAAVALAFIAVYQLTFDRVWLDRAQELGDTIHRFFWDEGSKQFFDSASDGERLIVRPHDVTDNAVPSGTSLAVELLCVLAEYFGDAGLREQAEGVLESVAEAMARYPVAFGHALGAADLLVHGAAELALVGNPEYPDFKRLLAEIARHYIPSLVIAGGPANAPGSRGLPLLEGRGLVDGGAAAYVCRKYTCELPATGETQLRDMLTSGSGSSV